MTPLSPVSPPFELPLASLLREFAVVLTFNLGIAVCLSLAFKDLGGFASDLVYSQCIGVSIFLVYCLIAYLPLPGAKGTQLLLRGLVAAPIGFSIGAKLAAWLVGDPTSNFMILSMPPVALVTTALATVSIVYFIWSRYRIREAQIANELATRLALETQLKLLRAQIEPHMLFNTLANLRTLVEVNPSAALHMLDELIIFLRGTLAASRSETGPLSGEFELLRAYLQLMQVRIGARLKFTLILDEPLKNALVPTMLLQPLVENAIKHGIEPAVAGGHIEVRASVTGRILSLTVKDTGLGMDASLPTEGYGLTHVRERLRVLYASAATLSTEALAPHGVCVRIDLPLKTTP